MGIELPAELVEVAGAAGVEWPEADEDVLRERATAWRQAATELTALATDVDDHASKTVASMTGAAAEQARTRCASVADPDTGTLAEAARGATRAADRLDDAAGKVGAAKVEIVRRLTEAARTRDAATTAAGAGHSTALLGLDTMLRATAAEVSAVHTDLVRTIGGDSPAPGRPEAESTPTAHELTSAAHELTPADRESTPAAPESASGEHRPDSAAPGAADRGAGEHDAAALDPRNVLGVAEPEDGAVDDLLGQEGPLGAGLSGHDGPPGPEESLDAGEPSPVPGAGIGGPAGEPDGLLPERSGDAPDTGPIAGPHTPTPPNGGHYGAGVAEQPTPPSGWAPVSAAASGAPVPGQQFPGQYPGQQVPGQVVGQYPGQPYPGQPYPGQQVPGQTELSGFAGAAPAPPPAAPPPAVPPVGPQNVAPPGPTAAPAAPPASPGAVPPAPNPGPAPPAPQGQPPASSARWAPQPQPPPPQAPHGQQAPAAQQPRAQQPQPPPARQAPQPPAPWPPGQRGPQAQPAPAPQQPAPYATPQAPARYPQQPQYASPPAPPQPPAAVPPPSPQPPPAPGAAAVPVGAPRQERQSMVALFLVHMFPIGHLPVASDRPTRQLPAPEREDTVVVGRYPPHDHPRSELLDDEQVRAAPGEGSRLPAPPPAEVLPAPPAAVTEGYDPLGGIHEREWDRVYLVRDGDPPEYAWPPHERFPEGASDPGDPVLLAEGALIDRFGTAHGRVFAADATPFAWRSLPPAHREAGYRRYRVLRELPVWEALSVSWFGQPGGGVRYRALYSAAELVALGYLADVTFEECT